MKSLLQPSGHTLAEGEHNANALPLPLVGVVLPAYSSADWQEELAARIDASGLCIAIIWRPTLPTQASPARFAGLKLDALIDLCGALDDLCERDSRNGIWRLADVCGVPLGTPGCGLASISSGDGARLDLIAHTDLNRTLIGSASCFADPRYRRSSQQLYRLAATLLDAALRELRTLGRLDDRPTWTPVGAPARWWQAGFWQLAGAWRAQCRQLRQRLYVEQWMIGLVDAPLPLLLHAGKVHVRWLGQRQAGSYWADPFGMPGRADYLYCEEYERADGVGRLVGIQIDAGGAPSRVDDIDLGLPGHLSYPYLFQYQGVVYCVAESAQSRRCVLYRMQHDGRWQVVTVLLADTAAADPTIFEWDGYFWLAYTDADQGAFDNLCLCYARNLSGPWRPHPQNPVKLDNRSARPAGTPFVYDGQLIRPAQVCVGGYGEAIALNRIVHCSPELYREESMRVLLPDLLTGGLVSNPHGFHTVSAWGTRTLVDAKRYALDWSVLSRKARARVGRLRQLWVSPTRPPV